MDDKVIEALDPLAEVRNVLDDEESFENNVLAEEKRKSSALNQLKIARSQSIGSNQQSSLLHTVTDAASEEDDVGELSAEDQDENVQTAFFQSLAASYAISTDFQRVLISRTGDEVDSDTAAACTILHKCMKIREKWIGAHPEPPQDKEPPEPVLVGSPRYGGKGSSMYRRRADLKYDVFDEELPCSTAHEYEAHMSNGVMQIHRVSISGESTEESTTSLFPVYSFDEYVADFYTVKHGVFFGPTGSYCHHNLELLTAKFSLHRLLNANRESDAQKSVPHRDFYNIRKVDTHVHHSACMNQKHLLRFIKHKLKTVPNEVVIFRDGKFLTLGEVFKSLNLTAYDLSVDTLDMHANNTFHRFDRFNLKYNPAGQSRLREIFLKTDNVIAGRYLAEITKEVMSDLESSKYQLVEWRVSIYGRKASEWDLLSRWFYVNRLSHSNVRWLIQIPRLYHIYKRSGEVKNFEELLNNIFAPLYAVSIDPSSNPALHYFLKTIVAFDSVDDESRPESSQMVPNMPKPHEWNGDKEPPYNYWMYYLYVNICSLNKFRASRNLCTFQLRPHCGEAGDLEHLISTYILAHQINHGILLRKLPALHYLYYLSQVGIAMSPLSNNKLFLDYNKNPFPKYFNQGMNVSLSTDDPLMLHYTKDALVEEYSVAAQVWKLSSTDQSEIARNSVLQSGWEERFKKYFLGEEHSDMIMTNVPVIRLKFREETLAAAIDEIKQYSTA